MRPSDHDEAIDLFASVLAFSTALMLTRARKMTVPEIHSLSVALSELAEPKDSGSASDGETARSRGIRSADSPIRKAQTSPGTTRATPPGAGRSVLRLLPEPSFHSGSRLPKRL